MRPRIVMLLAFVIAAVAVGFTGARFTYLPSAPPAVHAPLPGTKTSYLGVFDLGSPPTYGPIRQFAEAAGKKPNLVGWYSGWAQAFSVSLADSMYRHGLIPFVQIDPTLASVPAIAAGDDDEYLRTYADSVRIYGHPVVIGFGHEMNAPWYSWGYGHTSAATFKAAWRHIVTLFREQGADNVTWLWTIQADQPGTGPILSWWPGSNYVTWVGIDGYYNKPSDTFNSLFVPTIDNVRDFTQRPILLSEASVGRHANQPANILNLFIGVVAYKTLGLVWFDENQTSQPVPHGDPADVRQNWSIEGSSLAEQAFRLGVSELTLVPSRG
jgi:mannan endo-1,4-beta-mannosidase